MLKIKNRIIINIRKLLIKSAIFLLKKVIQQWHNLLQNL